MKGYRGGIFLVLGLFVAGCQSPASFGGAQPTDSPGESSAPSAEGTGPGDVSTTQPGTTITSKPSGKGPGPKVLGIPIDYKPSDIQYMEVSDAETYIHRQVSELTQCAPAKCTINLTREYVAEPYPFDPPEGEPPKQCAVDRGEWVGPQVSGGTLQLIVLSPCGDNPATKKTSTTKTSTTATSPSSSPAT